MARSGLTSDAVQNIIRAQATRAQRLAAADITLFNEGLDLEQLKRSVDALALNV
jgi:dephospho-CoA kinase